MDFEYVNRNLEIQYFPGIEKLKRKETTHKDLSLAVTITK